MPKNEESVGLVLGSNSSSFISLDIDKKNQKQVEKLLKSFTKQHKLGNCVLVKTSKNCFQTHFFWTGLPWQKVLKIIDTCEFVDKEFKQLRKAYGKNRLRIGKKGNKPRPKIIKIIKSPHHQNSPLGQLYYETYKTAINLNH